MIVLIRPTPATTIGFVAALICGLLFQFIFAEHLDNKILDQQFRILRHVSPTALKSDVVIVGIDEDTFERFREPLALWHPHLGKFFEALAKARPLVVGVDLVFPDKSYDFLFPGYDRSLLVGLIKLKRSTSIVLGQTVDEQGKLRSLFAPIVAIIGRDGVGLVLAKPDADGVVRRFESAIDTKQGTLYTLVGRIVDHLGLEADSGIIDYGAGRPFDYIPLQQVIDWYDKSEYGLLEQAFGGKPVLLGSVLPFIDRRATPIPLTGWEPENRRTPGVLIHAQALRSFRHAGLIHPASRLLIVSLTVIASLLWWLGNRPYWDLSIFAAGLALLWGYSSFALAAGVFWPVSGITFAGSLALFGRMGLEGVLAFRERRRLTQSFGRYVSPNVLREILDGRIAPGMGGHRTWVCVLFSDIRDFTKRSETQAPEAIVFLLNRYFNEMTDVIHRHGGTIDKFIGDGLMAFFGAPNVQDNPAQHGFNVAREMLEKLDGLNRTLAAQEIEPIEIGVGLHVGEVIVGHVGSESRYEYTVIGDTVNVAARLEGLTKALGYPIVCSADVAKALDDTRELDALDKQSIKGHAAVSVFGWRPC
jgi:class 3 adenylate cyclase